MNTASVELLNAAGTGDGSAVLWPGGHSTFVASSGSWGGGSIKLQIQVSGTNSWADVSSITLSADGIVSGFLPPGSYRAVATTATGNYARLVRIPY
jgi:hypothetical protein